MSCSPRLGLWPGTISLQHFPGLHSWNWQSQQDIPRAGSSGFSASENRSLSLRPEPCFSIPHGTASYIQPSPGAGEAKEWVPDTPPPSPPPSKPLFQVRAGLQRASQNTWGPCEPEKGTEGAQVCSFLEKELTLEHRAYQLFGMIARRHGTCLSGMKEITECEEELLGRAWNNNAGSRGANASVLFPGLPWTSLFCLQAFSASWSSP